MFDDYKISVIIPIYNAEQYLSQCVNSVINQTYSNIQIILVDDGSTDLSSKMCDEYKNTDPRVVVVHKKNEGVSKARNIGIDIADGDLLCFFDADDYVELNTFERLALNDPLWGDNDINVFSYFMQKKNGKEVSSSNTKQTYHYDLKTKKIDFQRACLLNQNYWPKKFNENIRSGPIMTFPVNKVYRKELIKKNNITFCEDIKLYEDKLFNFDTLRYSKTLRFIDEPLYHYRYNSKSAMHQNGNTMAKEVIKSVDKFYKKICGTNLMDELIHYFYCFVAQNIWTVTDRMAASSRNFADLQENQYALRSLCASSLAHRAFRDVSIDEIEKKTYCIIFELLKHEKYKLALYLCKIAHH